jgi:hypothetical protein
MPKSARHQYAARKAGAEKPVKTAYRIVDPNHVPDLRNEFAGTKVRKHHQDGKQHQVVHLTPAQAKFYLDSGSIEPLHS